MLHREPRPHDLIARNLRVAWSDVVTEPLPDRLRRLLEQLADEETEHERESGERRTSARRRPHN
jgi:hypothetical protein